MQYVFKHLFNHNSVLSIASPLRLVKISNRILSLFILLVSMIISQVSIAEKVIDVKTFLFNQALVGQLTFQPGILEQAVSKLEILIPNNPKVLYLGIQVSVNNNKMKRAMSLLNKLENIAPKSEELKNAYSFIYSNQSNAKLKLHLAEKLIKLNKPRDAFVIYQSIYKDSPPTIVTKIDYWSLALAVPSKRKEAYLKLNAIYSKLNKMKLISIDKKYNQGVRKRLKQSLASAYVYKGNDLMKSKGFQAAKQEYQKALKYNPLNTYAYVGLGNVSFQLNQLNQSEEYYKKAIQLEPNNLIAQRALINALGKQSPKKALSYLNKLSALKSQNFKTLERELKRILLEQEGDKLFEKRNYQKAAQKYQNSLKLKANDIWVTYKLALSLHYLKQSSKAKNLFNHLQSLYPKNKELIYSYSLFLQKINDSDNALKQLQTMKSAQWSTEMRQLAEQIRSGVTYSRADNYFKRKEWHKALIAYQNAYKTNQNDVWLVYRMAKTMRKLDRTRQALTSFRILGKNQPNNPEQVYAHALFLSEINNKNMALSIIYKFKRSLWTRKLVKLASELKLDLLIQKAKKLRTKGEHNQAYFVLYQATKYPEAQLLKANWLYEDDLYEKALISYTNLLKYKKYNNEANIGVIKTYISMNKKNKAIYYLKRLKPLPLYSLGEQREIANLWFKLGEYHKAEVILNELKRKLNYRNPNVLTAMIYRDSALVMEKLKRPEAATEDYKKAMVSTKLLPALPGNDDEYTYAMRNSLGDNWLQDNIKDNAAKLYKQTSPEFTIEQDIWRLQGEQGTSQMEADDTIIQYVRPFNGGKIFLRGDMIVVDAGRFLSSNGLYFDNFGTCSLGCKQFAKQKAKGFGLKGEWQSSLLTVSLGAMPIGFDVQNYIGDIFYLGHWNNIRWSLGFAHHPISNSLLSFAGATDPNTLIKWGGVMTEEMKMLLSYDVGSSYGLWGNFDAGGVGGKNVLYNRRYRIMGGYYYKLINETNRRLTIGISGLYWHYRRNLNFFSLGNGGYFSPQRFSSISLPIRFLRRTNNWSYSIEGYVSKNKIITDNGALYPIPSILPKAIQITNIQLQGESQDTYGYAFLASVERRLSSHFRLGTLFNYQKTPDYSPSQIMVYLRYTPKAWQGDLDMPVKPLASYAIYR